MGGDGAEEQRKQRVQGRVHTQLGQEVRHDAVAAAAGPGATLHLPSHNCPLPGEAVE